MHYKHLTSAICLSLLMSSVYAKNSYIVSKENNNFEMSATYWTPERMKNALPYPLPMPDRSLRAADVSQIPRGPTVGRDGSPPTAHIKPRWEHLGSWIPAAPYCCWKTLG